jgi:hypothetical protein
MMGLLALAVVGVALALALGFAISIWWLRPHDASSIDPIEQTAPTKR